MSQSITNSIINFEISELEDHKNGNLIILLTCFETFGWKQLRHA